MKINVSIERKPDAGDEVEVTMPYGVGGWFSLIASGKLEHHVWRAIDDRFDGAVLAARAQLQHGGAVTENMPITIAFDNGTEFIPLMCAISAMALKP